MYSKIININLATVFAAILWIPFLQGCSGKVIGKVEQLSTEQICYSSAKGGCSLRHTARPDDQDYNEVGRPTSAQLVVLNQAQPLILTGDFVDKRIYDDVADYKGAFGTKEYDDEIDKAESPPSLVYSKIEITPLTGGKGNESSGFLFTDIQPNILLDKTKTKSELYGFTGLVGNTDFALDLNNEETSVVTLFKEDSKIVVQDNNGDTLYNRIVPYEGYLTCKSDKCKIEGGYVTKGELEFKSTYHNAGIWLNKETNIFGSFANGDMSDRFSVEQLSQLTGSAQYDAHLLGMTKSKDGNDAVSAFDGLARFNALFSSDGTTAISGQIIGELTWRDEDGTKSTSTGLFSGSDLKFMTTTDQPDDYTFKGPVELSGNTCEKCYWETSFFGNSPTDEPSSVVGIFAGTVSVSSVGYNYWGAFLGYNAESLSSFAVKFYPSFYSTCYSSAEIGCSLRDNARPGDLSYDESGRPTLGRLDVLNQAQPLILTGNFVNDRIYGDVVTLKADRGTTAFNDAVVKIEATPWVYSKIEITPLTGSNGNKSSGFLFTDIQAPLILDTNSDQFTDNSGIAELNFDLVLTQGEKQKYLFYKKDSKAVIEDTSQDNPAVLYNRIIPYEGYLTCKSENCRVQNGAVTEGELEFKSIYHNAGIWLNKETNTFGSFANGDMSDRFSVERLSQLTGSAQYDAHLLGMTKSKDENDAVSAFDGIARFNALFSSDGTTAISGEISGELTWRDEDGTKSTSTGLFTGSDLKFMTTTDQPDDYTFKGPVELSGNTCEKCYWEASFFGNSPTDKPSSVVGIFAGTVPVSSVNYDYWGAFLGYKTESLDDFITEKWTDNILQEVSYKGNYDLRSIVKATEKNVDVKFDLAADALYESDSSDAPIERLTVDIDFPGNDILNIKINLKTEGGLVSSSKFGKGVLLSNIKRDTTDADYYVGGAWIILPYDLSPNAYLNDLENDVHFGSFVQGTDPYYADGYVDLVQGTAIYSGKAKGLYMIPPLDGLYVHRAFDYISVFEANVSLDVIFSDSVTPSVDFNISDFIYTNGSAIPFLTNFSGSTSAKVTDAGYLDYSSTTTETGKIYAFDGSFYGNPDNSLDVPESVAGTFSYTEFAKNDGSDYYRYWGVFQADKQ